MAGFQTIWAHPDLRLVTGVYSAQTVVAGASAVFGVEMAVQMTDFGSKGIGYLDSMMGSGPCSAACSRSRGPRPASSRPTSASGSSSGRSRSC